MAHPSARPATNQPASAAPATPTTGPVPTVPPEVVLDAEVLDWEMAACRALVVLLAGAIVLILAISPAIGRSLATIEICVATIVIVHFLLLRRGLSVLAGKRDRTRTLEVVRWVAVTLEVTYASAATFLVAHSHGAVWAMTSPVSMVYVFAMVTSGFRLRPAMSVYATALACVQWLAVYYLGLAPHLDAAATNALHTLQPWAAWERAGWLAFSGGLLAVTTQRLRQLALANRKQARLRRTAVKELKRLVSPDVAERALAGALVPGMSERRWVTVLFCDLRNFTSMCEHRRAEDVMSILNVFYDRACTIIRENGGHVNKFLGDGVLALFGAPVPTPHHAAAGVKCARALVRAAADLRARGGVWDTFEIGVGLDTGDVVLGAVGAADRLEYTAIGATVNRAARLQAISAAAGHRVVLSARTATELGDPDTLLSLGEAQIKGVTQPVRIYTPR